MKWLILLFSIAKPFFSTSGEPAINPITELKDMIKANAVKIVLLFTAASALATMFAAGIVVIAVDVGAQYDQNAYVYFSSMITMGLVLVLLPLVIGAIGIRVFQSEDRKEKEREVLTSVGTSHPLQDALALLIHDFVKEREIRRNEEHLSHSVRTTQTTEQTPEMPRH